MSNTFAIRDYSFANTLNNSLVPDSRIGAYSSAHSFSGPSPFDVPQSIEASLIDSDHIGFRFEYENSEESDHVSRPVYADSYLSASVELGARTGKILVVEITGSIQRFLDYGVKINPVVLYGSQMPRRNLIALQNNAAVVQDILSNLPKSFSKEVASFMEVHGNDTDDRAGQEIAL